jgi:hypothetical protein
MAEEALPPILYNTALAQTMERMEKVNALRKQKQSSDVNFLPSRAYCLLGHGRQPTEDSFIVPKDCIIVVKAAPGEVTYYTQLYRLWNRVLDPWRRSVYESPLCYMPKLIKEFGSLILYKPGDVCPNFIYDLRPGINQTELNLTNGKIAEGDNALRNVYCNEYGLIQLGDKRHKIKPITINVNSYFQTIIESLYTNSTVPTINTIIDWVGLDNFNTKSFKEVVNMKAHELPGNPYAFLPPESVITQKDLLQINPATGFARRTGVYYNFICRALPQTYEYYEHNYNRGRNNIKPTISSYLTSPPGVQNIIKQKLVEAEKRKQFLRGTRFNRPSATRRGRKSRRYHQTRRSRQ